MLNLNLEVINTSDKDTLSKYKNYIENIPIKNWNVELINNDFKSIVTPNKGIINFVNNIDWNIEPTLQYQSTLMWYYSLEWLILGYRQGVSLEGIKNIVNSFITYANSSIGEERLKSLTSRDHMSAMLLKNISYMATLNDSELKEECCKLISWLLPWCINEKNIKQNNHGMMLCSSIMHACLVFDFKDKNLAYEKSKNKLTDIIFSAFDSTGLCIENSPTYHAFYIRYIHGLITEAKKLFENDQTYIDNFNQLIKKAQHSLLYTALPNGELPSLGDGNNCSVSELKEGITNVEYLSTESGLYVAKQDDIYFSMKCGQSSITHKHVDDNSITLYFNNKPIILDCGMYNYDWKDPMTLCVKSQRGHSGPYWEKFDHLYPGTLYRQDKIRVQAHLTKKINNNKTEIIGFSSIDDTYNVLREVSFSNLEQINITDKFFGSKDEKRVIRFIFNGELNLHLNEGAIELEDEKLKIILRYSNCSTEIYRGTKSSHDTYMGWSAVSFGKVTPVWSVNLILNQEELTSLNTIQLIRK